MTKEEMFRRIWEAAAQHQDDVADAREIVAKGPSLPWNKPQPAEPWRLSA